jgi:hypothetical protein
MATNHATSAQEKIRLTFHDKQKTNGANSAKQMEVKNQKNIPWEEVEQDLIKNLHYLKPWSLEDKERMILAWKYVFTDRIFWKSCLRFLNV